MPDADRSVRERGIYVNQRAGKSSMLEMHDHPYFEIYFLRKGEREYFIGDRFYTVTEGDTVLIPPNTLHRTVGGMAQRTLLHINTAYLSRYFSGAMVESLSCLGGASVLRPAGENAARTESIYQSLLSVYEKQMSEGGQETLLAGYVFELLFLLSDKMRTGETKEASVGRMEQIVRYIHENYASVHSIGALADVFFLSKYHLCHLFKKHLGLSIVSYINMIRVRAACRMLDRGERNITELALAAGFNSSAYFCKVFKEQMHMTPLEYRKNRRENTAI
jgi:AraC-like DNA-binding protein